MLFERNSNVFKFYFFAGENYSVMLNYRNNYVAIRIINSIQKQNPEMKSF